MMEKKVAQFYSKVAQKVASVFLFKVTFFIIAQKVGKYLGYFCKKLCRQYRLKVAQCGHTA